MKNAFNCTFEVIDNKPKFKGVNGVGVGVKEANHDVIDLTPTTDTFKQLNPSNITIMDIREMKHTWRELKKDWLGEGKYTTYATGIFWSAFMTYIFPWMLDIAKVFCAFQIARSFYQEHRTGAKDGKTGFQSLVYYGKWYLMFYLLPWGVELIEQIGQKMHEELVENGAGMPK